MKLRIRLGMDLDSHQEISDPIDGVLIDTGSVGLRVLASALSLPLSQQTDAAGNAIGTCGQFQDGYTWGPVKTADIRIGAVSALRSLTSTLSQASPHSTSSGATDQRERSGAAKVPLTASSAV